MSEWFGVLLFAAFIVFAIVQSLVEGRKWKVRAIEADASAKRLQLEGEASAKRMQGECHGFQNGQNEQIRLMFESLGAIIKENTVAFKDFASATREYTKVMHERGEKHMEQNQIAALQMQQEELRGLVESVLKK